MKRNFTLLIKHVLLWFEFASAFSALRLIRQYYLLAGDSITLPHNQISVCSSPVCKIALFGGENYTSPLFITPTSFCPLTTVQGKCVQFFLLSRQSSKKSILRDCSFSFGLPPKRAFSGSPKSCCCPTAGSCGLLNSCGMASNWHSPTLLGGGGRGLF